MVQADRRTGTAQCTRPSTATPFALQREMVLVGAQSAIRCSLSIVAHTSWIFLVMKLAWFPLRYISSPTISAECHHIPSRTFVTLASDTCQITNAPPRQGCSWRWGQHLRPAHHRSPAPSSATLRCCPTPRAPPRRCCKFRVRSFNLQPDDTRVCTHFLPL